MVGRVLNVMSGTIFELKSCRAPKPVKFALHRTIRTETVRVLVKVTKPDIRDGTPVRAVHGTIRTVGIMSVVKITPYGAIADLTLVVAILAFSGHVSRQVMPWERPLAVKRTGHQYEQTLSPHFTHT